MECPLCAAEGHPGVVDQRSFKHAAPGWIVIARPLCITLTLTLAQYYDISHAWQIHHVYIWSESFVSLFRKFKVKLV